MTMSTAHTSPQSEISSSTITVRGRGCPKSISQPSSRSSPSTSEINNPTNGTSQRVTRSGRTVKTPATLQNACYEITLFTYIYHHDCI